MPSEHNLNCLKSKKNQEMILLWFLSLSLSGQLLTNTTNQGVVNDQNSPHGHSVPALTSAHNVCSFLDRKIDMHPSYM